MSVAGGHLIGMALRTGLILAMIPTSAAAQDMRGSRATASFDATLHPAYQALGATAEFHLRPSIALTGLVRKVFGGNVACIESTPTPCDVAGVGLGVGTRLTADSGGSWWPYLEGAVGGHRYSGESSPELFLRLGGGVGWFVGDRGSIRIGLQYERIGADPPLLPEWREPGASYAHGVVGLAIGVGIGMG